MKITLFLCFIFAAVILNACNEQSAKNEVVKKDTVMSKPPVMEKSYKDLTFDSKYDLVCGMPVTAGVSDTVHYKNKLYGFCSAECKDAFVTDPTSYLNSKK